MGNMNIFFWSISFFMPRTPYSLLPAPCSPRGRRGSTLLVTLLITTALLAVAVNLATVVTQSLQRSSLSVTTLPLLYQAESGAERALFRVRQLKVTPGELNMGFNCDCGGLCVAIGGCMVSAAFPTTPDLAWYPLRQNQSAQLDLLDSTPTTRECSFDVGPGVSPAACVDQLKISCQDADGVGPFGTLAITYTNVADTSSGWGGGIEGSTRQRVVSFGSPEVFNCPASSYGTFSFTGDPAGALVGSASYLVKIRAVRSDVNIKSVRAYYGATQRGLASRVRLTSTVVTPLQQQQVQLVTSSRAATSGLLDYVLYSECGIDKTVPTPDHACP